MRDLKYGLLSFLFFILLMIFVYYSPVKSNLTMWIGNRAYIPYVVTIAISTSIYFSIRSLYSVITEKKSIISGIITSLPIWIYLVWWVAHLF